MPRNLPFENPITRDTTYSPLDKSKPNRAYEPQDPTQPKDYTPPQNPTTPPPSSTNPATGSGYGGKAISLFGQGGLFQNYTVGDKYKDFFAEYDPTKEGFVKDRYGNNLSSLLQRSQQSMAGLMAQAQQAQGASGFAGSGALKYALSQSRQAVTNDFGSRMGLLGLAKNEGVFGLQEAWRQRQWDRLGDIMRQDPTGVFKNGSQGGVGAGVAYSDPVSQGAQGVQDVQDINNDQGDMLTNDQFM